MRIRALVIGVTTVCMLGAVTTVPTAVAAPAAAPAVDMGPDTVSDPVTPAMSPALRDLPPSTPPSEAREVPEGGPAPEPVRGGDLPQAENDSGPVQREIPGEAPADLVPVNSFAGGTADNYAGQASAFFPPDTVGDVGPNHYVQMVNSTIQIWNKQGTSLAGPTNINALWSGLPAGTPCRVTNDGDPIVLYDQAADRWMLAQFSVRSTPYQMCIAYSTTPDPTGTYFSYAFDMPDFPDYEKFGIWPDGLYMSTYEGANLGAFVFDRTKMLAGQAATYQRFTISSGGGPRQQRILPADWDGLTAPPAGAPNPFLMSVDAAVQGGAQDRLELYNFRVDWTTPANSTFTLDQTLPTDPFNIDIGSNCMGGGSFRSCVPQPGTAVKVDDLSNRLMWRLQYRNFGDHQALVTNQTVNSGNNTAALRWYELRSTGTSWSIHQQNTFAPAGNDYRWMGSAAMDGKGNIALGYSISNATDLFPSINYTGQRVGSPLNQLSEAETRMFTGVASQTGANRWGDYSAMSVDPVNECTFWYTQMHIGAGGTRQTRIGTAQFTSCAQPTAELKLVKVTSPNTVSPDLWTLKADAAAPLEGNNFSNLGGSGSLKPVYAGTAYALSETGGPSGYTPSDWLCKKDGENTPYPGQNGAAVTLTAGDKVTCQITNTKDTAQLKLKKVVSGDNGANGPGAWNLTATAASPLAGNNFTVAGTNDSFASVYSGTSYALTESGPGDYTGTWVCTGTGVTQTGDSVSIDKDGQGTCILTNERNTAQLSLEKKVSGGDKVPADWTLKAETTLQPPLDDKNISRAGNITTPAVVYSGIDYVLSEVGGPGTENYSAGAWSCKTVPGGVDVPLGQGNTINLVKDAKVACEITNTRDTARLKLVKKVEGGSAKADDWTLTAKAPAPLDDKDVKTPGGSGQSEVVYSGVEYTLAESGPGGYSPSQWDCVNDNPQPDAAIAQDPVNAGDKITLENGQRVTCTIVNTRDLGSLTIVKDFNPQASGYTGTFDIVYSCVDGTETVKSGTVTLGSGQSQTIEGVPTGSVCTVTEPTLPAAPSGWKFNPATFNPASGQVTVAEKGTSVSVTVINSVTATSPAGTKRTCAIDATLHTPKPTTAGNRTLTDKITTRKASCVLLEPVVLCRSVASSSAGERAFCRTKVTRKGRITVRTTEAVRVTVVVRVKPKPGFSDEWKADTWRRSWRLS